MRTKLKWVFGSILVAAMAVTACSSDDDDNKNNGGEGTGGSGGQGGDGGSGGDGGGTPGEGACNNDDDKAAGKAGYCPDNKSVSSIVSGCALDCLGSANETCTQDCVDEGTNNALSNGCRDCYIELTKCGSSNCLQSCLSDPGSAECVSCLCGENDKEVDCYAAFNECSGLGTTYCDEVADGTFTGYPEPDPPAQCDDDDTDAGEDETDAGDDDTDAGDDDPDASDDDPDASDEEDDEEE